MNKNSTPQRNSLKQTSKQKLSIKTEIWRSIAGLVLLSGLLMTLDNGTPDCSLSLDLVPFDCDGTLFLFQKTPTQFTIVEADGSLRVFGEATACPDGKTKLHLNGQGFRSSDGLIYGINKVSSTVIDLYRTGAEGRTEYYTQITAPEGYTIQHYVGEIDANSIYYFPGKGGPGNKKVVFKLDLNAVDQALANGDPIPEPVPYSISANLPSIHDWAFNPVDNKLYSIEHHTGSIVKLDITQDPILLTKHKSDGNKMGAFGAVYFGVDGTLYASQNNDGTHSNIYKINYNCPGDFCGERTLLGSSDKVSQNDGASCTFAQPSLRMSLEPGFAKPGDTLSYFFTFVNPTVADLDLQNFKLHLPDSMGGAAFLPNTLTNSSMMSSISNYSNTQDLDINQISVGAKVGEIAGETSFEVKVALPSDAALFGATPRVQASFEHGGTTHYSSDEFLPPGNATPVQIVQPYTITKRIVQGDPLPGNRIQYETTIFNPNDGGDYDGAYRVNFTDVLQRGGTFANSPLPSLQSSNGDFVHGDITVEDSVVTVKGIYLAPSDQVSILYYVDIDPSMTIGESVETEALAVVPNTNISTRAQENTITMPVEYLFFEAETRDDRAFLIWATAVEQNNQGFEVQKSVDGVSFENLGWVQGSGTTNNMQEYSFESDRLGSGSHVFRLKQIDFDGQFEYSKMVEISIEAPETIGSLEFGPNPFSDEGTAVLRLSSDQALTIAMYDITGRKVADIYKGKLRAGEPHNFPIKGSGLPAGYYIISARNDYMQLTKKILLQKLQ
ncbi:MAG: hypothetical protein AAF927_02695 [Bacteroidota bacterium]